jgi:hypothetical protein
MTEEQLIQEIKELTKKYKKDTMTYDALYAAKDAKLKAFELENSTLLDSLKLAEQEANATESLLRTKMVDFYVATKIKEGPFGLKIRITSRLEYDPAIAFKWATEHNLALTLDKKAFETIAKAQPLDFVTKVEVPGATIPSELIIDEVAQ